MNIDALAILFQILNFSILLFLLKKFVYGPILKILNDRASRIKEGLEAAEKNVQLQDKIEHERQKLIADAKKEAAQIVKQATSQAGQVLKDADVKAKAKAKQTLESERLAFEAQVSRQKAKLADQLSGAVSLATESVLRGAVDKKVGANLIDKQIKQLKPSLFA